MTAVPSLPVADPDATFYPTKFQRDLVERLIGYSTLGHDEICLLIINPATGRPISKATMHRIFDREVQTGAVLMKANLSKAVFTTAIGAPAEFDASNNMVQAERAPNPRLLEFLAKTQFGWNEKQVIQIDHGEEKVREMLRSELKTMFEDSLAKSRDFMRVSIVDAPTIDGEGHSVDDGEFYGEGSDTVAPAETSPADTAV
jgi:hypothetical protein